MDLRDQFAMAAAQGLLGGDQDNNPVFWTTGELDVDKVAHLAYQVADAMLRLKASTPKKQIPVPKR